MTSLSNEKVIDYSGTHFEAGALAQVFSDVSALQTPIKLTLNNCTFNMGAERDFSLIKENTNITKLEFKNPTFLSLNGEGLLEALACMGENKNLKEIIIRNWSQPSLGQFLQHATKLKQLTQLTIENIKMDLGTALLLEPLLKQNAEAARPIKINCTIGQLLESDRAEINENAGMLPNIIKFIATAERGFSHHHEKFVKTEDQLHISNLLSTTPHPDGIIHKPEDEVNLPQTPELLQTTSICDRSKDIIKYCLQRIPSTDFEAIKSHMEKQLQEGVRIIDFSGSYFNNKQFGEIQVVIQRNNNQQNPIELILDGCTFEPNKTIQQAKSELLKMPQIGERVGK